MQASVRKRLVCVLSIVILTVACNFSIPGAATQTPTATSTQIPTATSTITPTATQPALPTATETLIPYLPPESTPSGETAVAPTTGASTNTASKFRITLTAPATVCGDALSSDYDVTLTDTTITMLQIEYNITTTGPYNPATGAFTAIVTGIPGKETYTGTITFVTSGNTTTVTMQGVYTYTDDPDYSCSTPDNFSGQATITQ
jgi:hypothetical protein